MRSVKAAVKVGVERTEIRDFALPSLSGDDGILRVDAVGVGGSDPELYRMTRHTPAIMGHENVGTIAEIGDRAAERWRLQVGDRIALHEYLPCHACHYCLTGNHRLCARTDIFSAGKPQRYGQMDNLDPPHLWGGYAQYLYLPPQILFHRIPSDMAASLATLAVPLGNGWQWAVLEGGAGPGKTVLVFGPGQQGLGCVIASASSGADKVILVGKGKRDRARLDLALRLGADHVLDADDGDVGDAVRSILHGQGVDVVVDTTGDVDGSVAALSLELAAPFARLNLNGLDQSVALRPIKAKSLIVRAPRGRTYKAVELALKTMAAKRYPIEEMCTHYYALDEVHRAILASAGREVEGAIHVVVEPWR